MKKHLRYIIGLIIATIVLGVVATFVPPIWAMCICTYNEIKGFLVFPGSLFAGLIVSILTYLRVEKGHAYWKAFSINLACFVVIFGILGFLIYPISEYIKENDIPIFQPDYPDWNIHVPSVIE